MYYEVLTLMCNALQKLRQGKYNMECVKASKSGKSFYAIYRSRIKFNH